MAGDADALFILLGRFLDSQFHTHTHLRQHVHQCIKAEFVDTPAQHIIKAWLCDAEAFTRLALRCDAPRAASRTRDMSCARSIKFSASAGGNPTS